MATETLVEQPGVIPFPCPFGWFSACYGHELANEQVLSRRYLETDLVVWRDSQGNAHVQEAYCPHLGANLAVGGTVWLDTVVCPFHGWKFDGSGVCVEVPYSHRTNRRGRLRTFPVVERNGHVFFWWHPDPDVEPLWEIPHLDVLGLPDGPGDGSDPFTESYEWTVPTHWQEVAENAFDLAHFIYVHGLGEMGELGEVTFDGPFRTGQSTQQFNSSKGTFEGTITTRTYGPGLGVTHFHVFGHAYLVSTPAPIERRQLHNRFAWVFADDDVSQKIGPLFSGEVKRQFEQDMPIWINKRYVDPPALAAPEKAIADFRRWAAHFYDYDHAEALRHDRPPVLSAPPT